ncbi:hypothetical protein D3C87_2113120 [compost metagenome]
MDAIAQKIGGEILNPERYQIGRVVIGGSVQTKFKGWISGFAIENVERVAAEKLHWRCGQPHL